MEGDRAALNRYDGNTRLLSKPDRGHYSLGNSMFEDHRSDGGTERISNQIGHAGVSCWKKGLRDLNDQTDSKAECNRDRQRMVEPRAPLGTLSPRKDKKAITS